MFSERPLMPLGGSPSYLALNSVFGYFWICWRSMKIDGRWDNLLCSWGLWGSNLSCQPSLLWICWCPLSSIYLLSPSLSPRMNTVMTSSLILWAHVFLDIISFWFLCILISPNLFWVLFTNLFSLFSFLWLDQDYYVFNPNWKWKFSYCLKHLSSFW